MNTLRALTLAALLLPPLAAFAAPKAELWDRWFETQPRSTATIDHAAWNDFLARHVQAGADGVNRIAYGRVPAEDRAALDAYLSRLQQVRIHKFTRAEQRAYWINLYNAATVRVVLEHYPIDSIRRIDPALGTILRGPWHKKRLVVAGEPVSLDDIEHRILRPIWRDPRTHYALNCASVGCPNLQPRAYTPANMEALLEAGARAYVNHPRGANVWKGKLTVSSIYVWFEDDFGGGEAGVLAHLRKYAEPVLQRELADRDRVDGHDYDWSLNDAK